MKRVVITILVLAAAVALIPLRKELSRQYTPEWKQESMTYLPDNIAIKPVLLGFETTFAHYLWIRTVLYFGGHRMSDRSYPWIISMLDMITKLCPYFYPAYEFGGLMVPDICNNTDAARILLERGITHLGNRRWNLEFYLGMVYYKYYGDNKTAAECIGRAAFVQNAPRTKLLGIAQAMYTGNNQVETSLPLLYFLYQTSENPEVRSVLAEKISTILNTSEIDKTKTGMNR